MRSVLLPLSVAAACGGGSRHGPPTPQPPRPPAVAPKPPSGCVGRVLVLRDAVMYSDRSTVERDDGSRTGERYPAAEFAPGQYNPHGAYADIPAGTPIEIVHCEPYSEGPLDADPDKRRGLVITQGHLETAHLLFEVVLAVPATTGKIDLLRNRSEPLGATEQPNPVLTWNRARFDAIQNSIRTDSEGIRDFDLSQVVAVPPR